MVDHAHESPLKNPARAAERVLRIGADGANAVLEGRTSADCLITCERLVIWIEGKRTDKRARGIQFDDRRDQVARNLEAAWMVAEREAKDFRVVICSEEPLSGYEKDLVDGYRAGTLIDGLPHLDTAVREHFRARLLELRWGRFLTRWPGLSVVEELRDLQAVPPSAE